MSKYINENEVLKKLYEDFFDEIEQDEDVITTDISDDFNETAEYNFKLLITLISIPAAARKDMDRFYRYMERVQKRLNYILDNTTFIQSRSELTLMLAPQTTAYTWFRA